jgi:hypothetical protein
MRYAEALYESTYLKEKRLQEVLPIAATIGAGATAAKGFLVKKAGQFTAQFAAKKGIPALKKAAVGAAAPTALKRGIIKRTTGGVLAGPKKFFAKGASQAKKKVVGRIGGGIKAKGISIGPSVNVGTKRKIGLKSFSSTSKAKTLKAGPRGAPSRLEKGRTLVARGKRVGGRALTNIGIGGLGGAGVGGAVGGLTSDDPIGGAAKGALIGGTSGAIFGPIAGSTTGGRALNLGLSGLGGIGAGNRPKRQRF